MFQRQFYDDIKSIVSYVGLRAFAVAVLRGTDYLCIHCVLNYCCCLLLLNLLECLSYNICLISPSYVMKIFFVDGPTSLQKILGRLCCGEITSAVGLEISRFSVVQFFLDRSLPWQPLSELACCIRSVNYECRL